MRRSKKGFSIIVVVFSFIIIFALAAFVVDYSIVSNQRAELQKAVEMTALNVASAINLKYDQSDEDLNEIYRYPIEEELLALIEDTFDRVKEPNLLEHAEVILPATTTTTDSSGNTVTIIDSSKTAPGDVSSYIKHDSKAVKIYAKMPVQRYFSSVFDTRPYFINAQAAAIHMPLYLEPEFAVYTEQNIKPPIGLVTQISNPNNIYGPNDKKVVSLGPGGSIAMNLLNGNFIVDNEGIDFMIFESGHKEGYFVYLGIDMGATTKWVNVSCTGVPIGAPSASDVGAYQVPVEGGLGTQTKFYGSGMFDLSKQCGIGDDYNGDIKYANKIYIVDDNEEDGFINENYIPGISAGNPIMTLLLGDHSSVTPGADIDAIQIFHHAHLMPAKEIAKDGDGDGLLEYVENIIGTDDEKEDSDNDKLTIKFKAQSVEFRFDVDEYRGWARGNIYHYFTAPNVHEDAGVDL